MSARIKQWLFSGSTWILGIPYAWLLAFLIVPFLIILKLSFSEMALSLPPYLPLVTIQDFVVTLHVNLNNYQTLFLDPFYVSAYWNSLKIAFFSTLGCLLIGYPMAYCIARANPTYRSLLLMLVILPSWTSFLLRVYAWMGILQETGYLNQLLLALNIVDTPVKFLYTDFAIYLGIIYAYLPFMVLPIYVSISKIDWSLLKAAADLGARPWTAFWRITVPLTYTGILTGSLLVFIPVVGEFVIPDLLGGSGTHMIGRVLWQEFFNNRDWPLSAAIATLMLILLLLPIYIFTRVEKNNAGTN
ncbi:MAG: ABC transporter permease subunit [Legionellales bacterium]|jgi:putrescine transport system permease protein